MFSMQAFDFQSRKDSTKINQKYHLVAHDEFEQPAHMFVMEAIEFQTSKETTRISQKAHLVALVSYNNNPPVFHASIRLQEHQGFHENHSKISPSFYGSVRTTSALVCNGSVLHSKQQRNHENHSKSSPSCPWNLELQSHMFSMQSVDFQNTNDSTNITHKSQLVAQM